MESLRGASGDRRGPLRKRFCHCLCEERKDRSNGKSSELHVVNLISEMGFFRWCFCPFSPSYLYLVRNTFKFYYWRHFLRCHSCFRFYQNTHLRLLVPDISYYSWGSWATIAHIHNSGSMRNFDVKIMCIELKKKVGHTNGKNQVDETWRYWFEYYPVSKNLRLLPGESRLLKWQVGEFKPPGVSSPAHQKWTRICTENGISNLFHLWSVCDKVPAAVFG